MSERVRRKICLILGAVALCAGVLLYTLLIKTYAHTVPVPFGPYKQAAFIVLLFLLAAVVGFWFKPLNRRTISGLICIAFAVLWFTGRMLLAYRSPESSWLFRLDQWMPIPMLIFGVGAALWIGEFLPNRNDKPTISEHWQLLMALLIMFICLQPILSGGFNWDDAFFSVEAQALRITGESIFQRVWQEIVEYVQIGRINPFATFHFLTFYFLPDARAYKWMLALLTLLNGWLFYRFLRIWGEDDHRSALAALLIVPLCFQLRMYHDPLNSYYGLMQVMFCELMLPLIGFVRWMREGRKSSLVLSLLVFTMGLMSYEMFFPLTALFLIPAWMHEKKIAGTIRRMLPYVLIAVLLFGASMLLRTNITEETAYTGTTFGLEVRTILETFAHQVTAAFPLRYRTAGFDTGLFGRLIPWRELFNTSLSDFFSGIQWGDLIACGLLILILAAGPDRRMRFSPSMTIFGALLWLLPGLVISMSTKYQQELRPGLAYIPVYFSCFGAALILYEIIALFGGRISPRTMRLILGGIGCVTLLIAFQDNRHIESMLKDIFLYPREAGEAALQAGILGEYADENTRILSAVPYSLWEHGWQYEPYQSRFYSLNARRKLNAEGVYDFVERQQARASSYLTPANTTLITYSGDAEGGFAKSGRLRGTGIDVETHTLNYPLVTDLFFFVSGKNEGNVTLVYETKENETKRLPVTEAWLVRKTDKGTLYKLQENQPIYFDSVGLIGY